MLRFSVNEDKEKLIDLWCNVFGDEREAVNLFFDYHYKPENTLVFDDNGKIASMLYLLEGSFVISDTQHPSYYLYAAATGVNYRGRGIMGEMLRFARETAANRGKDYICLLPAEKSLYDYYCKHGYKTVFRKKTVRIKNELKNKIYSESNNIINLEKSRKDFFSFCDRFEWDNNAIEYAVKQNDFYGGECFVNCNGYCLYNANGNKTVVKESTLQNISSVCFDTEITELVVPVDYSVECFESEISDNGMALPLNKNAAVKIENLNNAYLGLTLD